MKANNSSQEQKLWNDWLNNNCNDAANDLIQNYMYLVSFHVERISSHLPSNVNKDDIRSFGLIGLYDALKKFEPSRDLKFDTYASFRIRGAIIDGLRKEDWLPRSLREKTKKIERVSRELEQHLQREPTAEEIAVQLDMTPQEVEGLINDSLFANVLSIEEKPTGSGSSHKEGVGYTIPDETAVMPEDHILNNEINGELIQGIKSLNKNEQMVISLFYNDELTLTEIGQVLGLTTSRISQIHKKSIFKLRNTMKKIQAFS
ncbi:FliA/WhiG family RNA polymerase sigma factor [Virgibacillus profundi]|uniref:FliA/WhiG family RNA polymerase sigma factor n=1 Tax=Virgibacillus profundi TaxID=2024555 RepID=A0A2A2IFL9_9BACI|nr:FliA/WhiG family RNA polymerase sigma factor [Virgibacillus profundi]PAV30024.1 FliA/WhiG family RNA polymerase sigma factor [Virgibacillus profundi]PXY54197.1 FliA/WhiG family RNA polymerase sigma factor [Virgibacillus profundi]